MSETPKDIDFINLNDIKSNRPDIPDGQYHVKIVDGEVRENNAKDGLYVSYTTVIQSGQHVGTTVYGMWSLKDTAQWKLARDFKAIGYAPIGGTPHLAELINFEGIAQLGLDKGGNGFEPKFTVLKWIAPLK